MKINNTTYQDPATQNTHAKDRTDPNSTAKNKQEKPTTTIQASELNLFQDPLTDKKQKAQKDAMDLIKQQFESDSTVDDTMDEFRSQIDEGKEQALAASNELKYIREQKAQLAEEYKDHDCEEYKAYKKDLDNLESHWAKELNDSKQLISDSTSMIRAIKQETLKHHGMIDANNAAQDLLEASSKEIAGMLLNEAKENVDKDLEETIEKAEEANEQKAEQEEHLKETQAEQEKRAKEPEEEQEKRRRTREARAASNYVSSIDTTKIAEQQRKFLDSLQVILDDQKIMPEEIKGIVVDLDL